MAAPHKMSKVNYILLFYIILMWWFLLTLHIKHTFKFQKVDYVVSKFYVRFIFLITREIILRLRVRTLQNILMMFNVLFIHQFSFNLYLDMKMQYIPYQFNQHISQTVFLFCSVPFRSVPFHSVPFRSIPFRSVPFRSVLFLSVPFRSIPFHSIPFRSVGI